jgi:hypothetical protein
MQKSLDRKLAALAADPNADVFILADAKDADMAFGIGAPGQSPEMHAGEVRFRTLREYRDIIRRIVKEELVDIMLMSAGNSDELTIREGLFRNSSVTPAARANDTTDIWAVRGGSYVADPSRPFRTADLDHIMCGHLDCAPAERSLGADLGLYSVTFNNNTAHDLATLNAYGEFRREAERKGFRHFLEVFDPNAAKLGDQRATGRFINDMIARTLAGVAGAGRPTFLKIVYHGPEAMEELHRYDPNLVIGILGGSAGTTYDAFKLLAEARKYGARVALYGRKINNAENQFAFIRFLRLIVDGAISPEEAVRAYHGVLERLGVRPHRSLADDMVLQTGVMSYGGGGTTISIPAFEASAAPPVANGQAPKPASSKGVMGAGSSQPTSEGSIDGMIASLAGSHAACPCRDDEPADVKHDDHGPCTCPTKDAAGASPGAVAVTLSASNPGGAPLKPAASTPVLSLIAERLAKAKGNAVPKPAAPAPVRVNPTKLPPAERLAYFRRNLARMVGDVHRES